MTGKFLTLILVLAAAIAGGSLYYLQVYAYYDEVTDAEAGGVTLVANAIGKPIKIVYDDFQAIDSDSSPLRFRACFSVTNSLGMLTENFRVYEDPVPTVAPSWFDCFDAKALGAAAFGILGYSYLTRAMRTGEVSAVTPFRYTRLLFALLVGVVVFGERPDALTLAGSALIVACGLTLLLHRPQR